jgi:hypothetical protein
MRKVIKIPPPHAPTTLSLKEDVLAQQMPTGPTLIARPWLNCDLRVVKVMLGSLMVTFMK